VSGAVAFGVFEFDPETGLLSREGTPVRLQPQPARVLAILVAQAGTIVTRESLRQHIWADGTFVDFERGLNFCVAQIRSALGDTADSPRFIETLPRRGYRFVAPVRPVAAARNGAIVPPVDSASANRRASMRWVPLAALAVFAVLTAALAVGAWRAGAHEGGAGAHEELIRVAVVPFDNETGLDAFDLPARGVADATVARLATPERLRRIRVIGNAAALYQPRAFRDLKRIGEALDADYIVLAQMKRDRSQVCLIAHLIRVGDEVHLWANTYDAPEFTLAVQADIAESIARAVAGALDKPSSSRP
jgi:DNA-binding winged helix-turn-helix (wHTH) protein/TolB-like protein